MCEGRGRRLDPSRNLRTRQADEKYGSGWLDQTEFDSKPARAL